MRRRLRVSTKVFYLNSIQPKGRRNARSGGPEIGDAGWPAV